MNWHVIPIDDLKPHEELSTCACAPRAISVGGNLLIVHNSYDQREISEKIVEKLIHNCNGVAFSAYQEPKTCDCQLKDLSTGPFMCHGMCKH